MALGMMAATGTVREAWTQKDEAQWKTLCERRQRVRTANLEALCGALESVNEALVESHGISCGVGDTEALAEALASNADLVITALSPFAEQS